MINKEFVILVDEKDNEIGIMEKEEAHVKAMLHRAFSIFIFNDKNELLLQKRALSKYHSGGMWTNTCCSHPRQNESITDAAHRRLCEEMGFDCELNIKHKFIYKARFDNGLTEHEFDYVLKGIYNKEVFPNSEEVSEYKWVDLSWVLNDMQHNKEKYTPWFNLILSKSMSYLL
ncbi:MAG: isopentenyl-diphosphate Delta-isomerase [Bacteroidetes bacterium]|nr:isopentenyl-diphosphate Delta-isomerase [Bacteroidota bacterium]